MGMGAIPIVKHIHDWICPVDSKLRIAYNASVVHNHKYDWCL